MAQVKKELYLMVPTREKKRNEKVECSYIYLKNTYHRNITQVTLYNIKQFIGITVVKSIDVKNVTINVS